MTPDLLAKLKSHQYIKGSPDECFICGERKNKPLVNATGMVCSHECAVRELQGDGRWIWCPKCKSYLDQPETL
jgi:hypothetical protein